MKVTITKTSLYTLTMKIAGTIINYPISAQYQRFEFHRANAEPQDIAHAYELPLDIKALIDLSWKLIGDDHTSTPGRSVAQRVDIGHTWSFDWF